MDRIYKYIVENTGIGKIDKQVAIQLLTDLKEQERQTGEDIAIIGMSVNMPFASDIEAFWESLRDGRDCITEFPDSRRKDIDSYLDITGVWPQDKKYMKGAYLESIDYFDYRFFHFSPKEASLMDPCQRLFLQTAWQAVEDAGYSGAALTGSKTGVYIGFATTLKDNYQKLIYDLDPSSVPVSIISTLPAMIPTRLSYMLDLKGPTVSVDTACSSSLVAVHLACQGIKNGECDMAIAGGVKLHTVPIDNEYVKLGIEASDGRTKAFDDASDGTGIGEGVGAVILKPYKKAINDGDNIYAVIKGSAINQDGKSIGITAPNQVAQAEVLLHAWKNAGIHPETISYIQTHGTGTELGDPIEIDGLKRAFGKHTGKKQFCAIGSVKTNVGHLYEGAGIINLISAALAVKNGQLPPSLHFEYPNRKISFEDAPVYINDRLTEWDTGRSPRRCGVSSFGFSGTNCHIVLEGRAGVAPEKHMPDNAPSIFVLSAQSKEVLKEILGKYKKKLSCENNYSLEDICFTAGTGRNHHNHRIAFVAFNKRDLLEKLDRLCTHELDDASSHGCYWGVVRADPNNNNGGEDRTGKAGPGHVSAKEDMEEYYVPGDRAAEKLEELCRLYTGGACINWDRFYKGRNVKRVSLPAYTFEKSRCWLKADDRKRAMAASKKEEQLFYGFSWREKRVSNLRPSGYQGTVLAFSDDAREGQAVLDTLRARGRKVITVTLGPGYEKTDAFRFTIRNVEEDYARLMSELREAKISQILFMHTLSHLDEVREADIFDGRQAIGVTSLFFLTRALQRYAADCRTEIILFTSCVFEASGSEQGIYPEHATLVGLGKVVAAEAKNVKCRSIDIDFDTDVNRIADELYSDCKSYQVSFRKGKRYEQEFHRIRLEDIEKDETAIRENGVYIITGGLGGIGMETAKYFSSRNRVALVLVNRTPIPPRSEWDRILNSNQNKKLCKRLAAIEQIERTGSSVECISADISDEKDVEGMLRAVKGKYGKINGIVHGAGIAGDGFILNKAPEAFNRVLAPKVRGTWLIDRLTDNESMDFLILYSSGASILGEPGQGDYTAANTYLDSFAEYRTRKGKKTLAINWVAWKETGMAFDHGANFDTFFKAISTDQAIHGLDEVFNKGISRVLIGELNADVKTVGSTDKLPFELSEEIKASVLMRDKTGGPIGNAIKGGNENVILKGKTKNESYTELEKAIGNICKEVLGYKEVDVYENFFDLGGDSVLMVKMHAEIDRLFPGRLTISDMFSYASIARLAAYLDEGREAQKPTTAADKPSDSGRSGDIAIIGVAARLPQAGDISEFWDNLAAAKDCIIDFPGSRERDIRSYASRYLNLDSIQLEFSQGGFLEQIDRFDYSFFRMTPKEARFMDPNQRLFLETVWEAMEDSGYGGDRLAGSKTGVYVGFAKTVFDYDRLISDMHPSSYAGAVVGNLASVIPGRLAYLLDFKGATAAIDTACSSALVAVHTARKAIINGECDLAFAGGIKINLLPLKRGKENSVGIESSDDRARTFDDSADGTGIGEGVGVVVLKPLQKALEDGDHIYAVIKGSAVNNDGASASLTSPNSNAQAEVLLAAWEDAGIHAETLSYMEAHGTGTKLGDPIEIDGIKKAFAAYTAKRQFCAIGSVKTNIGHLYEGAGIASLIKSILILKNRQIPPSLHFMTPNRRIPFEESPVYVNDRLIRLENKDGLPLRCAVSAFGFSGTNCHVVLEEAPVVERGADPFNGPHIFTASAKSLQALKDILRSFAKKRNNWINKELDDICYTLSTGRGHYNHRFALLIRDKEDLVHKLGTALSLSGFMDMPPDMFYGEHRICGDKEGKAGENCITNDEKRVLSGRAADILSLPAGAGGPSSEVLRELCGLYAAGAEVCWEQLFTDRKVRLVSLPCYRFEKNRCWLDDPGAAQAEKDENRQLHYHLEWEREELQVHHLPPPKGTYLIIKDESGLHAEIAGVLKGYGNNVVEAAMGEGYADAGDNSYEIGPCLEDYMKLIASITAPELKGVIHLSSIRKARGADSLESLEKSLQMGVYSLFYLVKAIAANIPKEKQITITIVSRYVNRVDNGEELILPENACLFGLGRVIGRENPNIKCKCIDIDGNTQATRFIGELACDTGTYQAAYRAGKRYVEVFKELTLAGAEGTPATCRKEGVYIITGGLGGIGLEMAKYLAGAGAGSIALINRTKLPERSFWDEISTANKNHRLCEKIKTVREIEAYGARVVSYVADISDYARVKQILDELGRDFGKINGIIHNAGISVNKLLTDKSDGEFRETILPKVHGTWILDELTRGYALDFFVMSSSVATVFSSQGQGDYAAANAYLDAFAWYRNGRGRRALSVNWVAWKEAGMSVEHRFTYDTIFKAINTRPAVKAFHQALTAGATRVLIGELNYESGISQLIKNYPLKLSADILKKLEDSGPKGQTEAQASGNLQLEGRENGEEYSDIDRAIAQICREEMGYDSINIRSNFFEMGGDSIIMAKVKRRLSELYPGRIYLTDIFEYPTIEKLARHIEEQDIAEGEPAGLSFQEADEDMEAQIACIVEGLEKGDADLDMVLKDLKKI